MALLAFPYGTSNRVRALHVACSSTLCVLAPLLRSARYQRLHV